MCLILHIETATKQCSVSLAKQGVLLGKIELAEEGFNHAEKLHVFISQLMSESQLSLQNLDAVCVSKGPGSYTGLRIGVSAAKGLCYTLDIPLLSINTLEILARKLKVKMDEVIIPMIDARRMEVFTAHFSSDYCMIKDTYALILNENSFQDVNAANIHIIGDGAAKAMEILTDKRLISHSDILYPSSEEMTEKAYQKYQAKEWEDVAYFEPFYLKEFMLTPKK